ncbi:hypothetical protein AGLY_005277 [Aphis glycines]|uniref:Uncharacterized protein n=1 Tax=Aphis glycines TaxID=307491 RepID=A0A6G0TW92_APHGL|nr:hypothetical protein AGLY_005277 [Aphis glycines]
MMIEFEYHLCFTITKNKNALSYKFIALLISKTTLIFCKSFYLLSSTIQRLTCIILLVFYVLSISTKVLRIYFLSIAEQNCNDDCCLKIVGMIYLLKHEFRNQDLVTGRIKEKLKNYKRIHDIKVFTFHMFKLTKSSRVSYILGIYASGYAEKIRELIIISMFCDTCHFSIE